MTHESSKPQIFINSMTRIPDISDLLRIKDEECKIYYNGKLLPENLDPLFRDTLIDYAALNILKGFYPFGKIEKLENCSDEIYIEQLSYSFGWDLKNLKSYKDYKKLFEDNLLARKLIAAACIVSAKYDKLGIELLNGLGEFKELMNKIEENITPSD